MCESVNQDNYADQLTRAGYSIQAAIRHWNNAANWKWLGTTTENYTMTVGVDSYDLPALCKNVHSVRVNSSNPRSLEYIGRRPLNKAIPRQDQQLLPTLYDLFRSESTGGKLRLFPIPSLAETFVVDYYRQMVVPCAVTLAGISAVDTTGFTAPVLTTCTSTAGMTVGSPAYATSSLGDQWYGTVSSIISGTQFYFSVDATRGSVTDGYITAGTGTCGGADELLDIPADYEDGILAWACQHYLANRQGGGPKLQYWAGYAMEQLDKALRNNQTDTPDQEICILPASMGDTTFLGPNDIRWADVNW